MLEKKSTNNELTFIFSGDLCIRGRTSAAILEGRSEDIFRDIMPVLIGCDISLVNLENPFTDKGEPIQKSGPNLKAGKKCASIFDHGKFDIVALANNHIGDFGDLPVIETIKILKAKNKMVVGAGKDLKNARKPLYFNRKGYKVGILAFAENEFSIADEKKAGAWPLQTFVNLDEIKEVSENVDITIVLAHGGNEYNPIPSPGMTQRYRAFIDAGASAVIGGHPHCPQGLEIYKGHPIAYSIGNFLFDKDSSQNKLWWNSYMLKLIFKKDKTVSYETIPYTFAPDATKIKLLRDKEKEHFLLYLRYISELITKKEELEKYWNAWCIMMNSDWLMKISEKWGIFDDEGRLSQNVLSLRNLFTCEAHNELKKTFLKLLCDNEIDRYREYIPDIKRLQDGDLPLENKRG